MHRLLRNTHLILGMSGVLFVLLYAVSAVQMAHRIRVTPVVTEEDMTLPSGMEARALAAQLGYAGELGQSQKTAEGFRVNIVRPGVQYIVSYATAAGRAHVRTETRSWLGLLNRLHHQHGVRHSSGRLNAWGWALLAVSLALLGLGITGVYLWFKTHRERRIGIVLLGANLAVSLVLLVAMR